MLHLVFLRCYFTRFRYGHDPPLIPSWGRFAAPTGTSFSDAVSNTSASNTSAVPDPVVLSNGPMPC